MGISSLPTPCEAFFPFLLLANALTPVIVLVDGMRWAFLHVMGSSSSSSSYQSQEGEGGGVLVGGSEQPADDAPQEQQGQGQEDGGGGGGEGEEVKKRVHVTRFNMLAVGEKERERERDECCCVCLHGFEGEEEVSEVVACRHLFHRGCLERWLSHLHSTCPLCRSML